MRGREREHRKTRTGAWKRGNRGWCGGATLSGGASGGDEAASQASSVTFWVSQFLISLLSLLQIRRRRRRKRKGGGLTMELRLVSSSSSSFVDFSLWSDRMWYYYLIPRTDLGRGLIARFLGFLFFSLFLMKRERVRLW